MKSVNIVRETPEYFFTVRGDYNEENKTGEFHCTIFQPEGKYWKRSDIVLHQTWYPCEDVKSALKNAGFSGILGSFFQPATRACGSYRRYIQSVLSWPKNLRYSPSGKRRYNLRTRR